jgi:hypothetical protein
VAILGLPERLYAAAGPLIPCACMCRCSVNDIVGREMIMMIGHGGPRDDDVPLWHDDVIGHCGPTVGGMTVALLARRGLAINDTFDGPCGLSCGITYHVPEWISICPVCMCKNALPR